MPRVTGSGVPACDEGDGLPCSAMTATAAIMTMIATAIAGIMFLFTGDPLKVDNSSFRPHYLVTSYRVSGDLILLCT